MGAAGDGSPFQRQDLDGPSGRVVIGQQIAAALAAEARHAENTVGDSPIAEVAYDWGRGEGDLFRFVEAPVDARLSRFVEEFFAQDELRRAKLRSRLAHSDFYTLLTFARRCALLALRTGDPAWSASGCRALATIELERVDWRDVAFAAGMLGYAAQRLDADAPAQLDAAASRAEQPIAALLNKRGKTATHELKACGLRELQGSGGVVLVEDNRRRFEPTADLYGMAEKVIDIVEGDIYRVTSLAVGTDLPRVWLRAGDRNHVTRALESLSGCVSIHARPRAEGTKKPAAQMLLILLCEAGSAHDAEVLAAAARPPADSEIAELGMSDGRLCAVVVGRSVVQGVRPNESAESILRFRDRLHAVIAARP